MKNFRYLFLLAISLLTTPAFCQGQDSGFDGLDTNSDGKVTIKEFQEYAKGRMPDSDQLDKFVGRVDADKDGEISEDEFDGRMDALRALQQGTLNGGDKKKKVSKEQRKMVDDATKAFDATAKLASEGDWEKAAEAMTKQASDDYAIATVTQGITLTQMKLPPQLDNPVIDTVKEATMEVLEEYKLNDIDISFFLKNRGGNRRPQGGDDDGDDSGMTPQEKTKARQEKAKAKQEKLKAEVVAALDENNQRWEIVTALRDAQEGSPIFRDVFANKISDSTADGSLVFLTLTRAAQKGKAAIPTVVKMVAEEGSWKYDGIDLPRTQQAMQQMMQQLRKRSAPAEPESDF